MNIYYLSFTLKLLLLCLPNIHGYAFGNLITSFPAIAINFTFHHNFIHKKICCSYKVLTLCCYKFNS